MLISSAVICLALNIYSESRSESVIGQYAVAQVTLNRAREKNEKVCDVVSKPYQFSWAVNTFYKKGGSYLLTEEGRPKDKLAWAVAKAIAEVALKDNIIDFSKGATFYHTKAVSPFWKRDLKLVAVIGSHKFYASKRKS